MKSKKILDNDSLTEIRVDLNKHDAFLSNFKALKSRRHEPTVSCQGQISSDTKHTDDKYYC